MRQSLTQHAKKEIKEIHCLSGKYNKLAGKGHQRVLLDLVREHAKEIDALYRKADRHYLVETGDLMILCLEILLEAKASPDEVLAVCYGRYKKKIAALTEEYGRRAKQKAGS